MNLACICELGATEQNPAYVCAACVSCLWIGRLVQVLDSEGVGQLIKLATEGGRARRPGLKVGLCGEQGGDPASVEFVHSLGLDYVSCSPFRVPIARLAAAQAAIRQGSAEK